MGVDVLSGVLRDQAAAGVPVVFSSHQLELVERLCESVVLINAGHIVADGRVADLRADDSRRLVRVEVVGAPNGWLEAVEGVRILQSLPEGAIVELFGLDARGRGARRGAGGRRGAPFQHRAAGPVGHLAQGGAGMRDRAFTIGVVGLTTAKLVGSLQFTSSVLATIGIVLAWFVLGFLFYARSSRSPGRSSRGRRICNPR